MLIVDHRPEFDRPPLQQHARPSGWSTSRSRREPDAGHHHVAELLPALRQARRHDGTPPERRRPSSHEIYKLGVVSIPTNTDDREDQSDLIYKTEEAKYIAVVDGM